MPKVSEYPEDVDPAGTDLIAVSGVATSKVTIDNLAASAPFAALYAGAGTYQPLDSDLTAIAALSTTAFGRALLALADASTARTTIGVDYPTLDERTRDTMGTALVAGTGVTITPSDGADTITIASTAPGSTNLSYNASTITVQSDTGTDATLTLVDTVTPGLMSAGDKLKLDGIETAADITDTANVTAAGALMDSEVDADIKTLSLPANTTISAFGASLVDDADAAAARTTLGLGTAATTASSAYDAAGAAAAAQAASQPLDSDLTAIAALSTTAFGRGLLALADAAALRASAGLDADLGTLSVPASTTISAFGATLVDDADAAAARTTLGLAGAPVVHTYNGVAFPTRASIAPLTTPVIFTNHIDNTPPTDMVDGLDLLVRRVV